MNTSETTEVKPVCHICGSHDVRFFCAKGGHDLYDCTECGLTFVHPIPGNLGAIYSEEYFKNTGVNDTMGYTDYDKDKEPMRPVFELYLDKLARLTSGKKIFDVGAATGYFLDIAKEKGWETYGSEISEYGAAEAQKRGHAMVYGDLSVLDELPSVDAVTIWDVLEHVDRPREYLEAINRMTKEGGMLAINTVDRSSMWARIMGSHWHLIIPPEHLYYYSPKNLEQLLNETGFEVIEVAKLGKKFSPAYIFKMLGNWQKLPAWNVLARMTDNGFFRIFSMPINLRDNIFVLARKVSK